MANHAHRGELALNAGRAEEAIAHYTEALKQSASPLFYIKRSTAYQRHNDFPKALEDAEAAVVLAVKRAKRELIGQAQLRRGIALFHLEQYGNARLVFGLARKYDDKEKSLAIWDVKVNGKLKTLEVDDVRALVTTTEVPEERISQGAEPSGDDDVEAENEKSKALPVTPAEPGDSPLPIAANIRHDWYQNTQSVSITLMAKGAPLEQTSVEILPTSLSISFPTATGSDYNFTLDPLFSQIVPASSTYSIKPTKIELVLKKQVPGKKWASLESTTQPTSANDRADVGATTTASVATAASMYSTAPTYPTSSRSGPKNWDKIVDSYKNPAKSSKGTEAPKDGLVADETQDDDGFVDSDDEAADPVNGFFKKLYKGASEDTRRAMMKSYQESGGTALSTNWAEVGKAPVPISPPDGMEAKKWEQ